MGQTIANMAGILKDAWTSETIQKQFYNENPLLEQIKEIEATVIGQQAQVPIHKTRNGGYTSVSAAGGALNPAGQQGTDQAVYTMPYHWMQVALETAVLNQSGSSAQSIIAGKDLEMQGAIDDMNRQLSRQIASDGSGLIAQCGATSASTTVNLAATGYGPDAIIRGHLHTGQVIDIGTTADSDSQATGVTIIDVDETVPSITVSSAVTTTTSHFISIANPNSATAPDPELNGFRNLAGSTTSTVGGINPATPGNGYWKPALVDTTSTAFTLDVPLKLQRATFQRGGKYETNVFTSAKQQENFYSLLQNQVRFSGEVGMGAGNVGGLVGMKWNGLGIHVLPDIYDRDWFHIHMDDLVRITGSIKVPTWVSDLEGAGGDFRWVQGTTGFGNAVVWPFQIGVQRRNRMAAATNLTA